MYACAGPAMLELLEDGSFGTDQGLSTVTMNTSGVKLPVIAGASSSPPESRATASSKRVVVRRHQPAIVQLQLRAAPGSIAVPPERTRDVSDLGSPASLKPQNYLSTLSSAPQLSARQKEAKEDQSLAGGHGPRRSRRRTTRAGRLSINPRGHGTARKDIKIVDQRGPNGLRHSARREVRVSLPGAPRQINDAKREEGGPAEGGRTLIQGFVQNGITSSKVRLRAGGKPAPVAIATMTPRESHLMVSAQREPSKDQFRSARGLAAPLALTGSAERILNASHISGAESTATPRQGLDGSLRQLASTYRLRRLNQGAPCLLPSQSLLST